jgi:integrase
MAHATKFPLYKHAKGRWSKTVRYKTHYFLKVVDDPTGSKSLAMYLEQKEFLVAGVEPPMVTNTVRVSDILNAWLEHKETLLKSKEITQKTFEEYEYLVYRIVEAIPKQTDARFLTQQHFAKLKQHFTSVYNVVSTNKRITQTKSIFKFALETGMIKSPVVFGPGFKPATVKTIRLHQAAKGDLSFTAAEIQSFLIKATPNHKACILLGINCGFGPTDCIQFRPEHIRDGWMTMARAKTGTPRRCKLWPETLKALDKSGYPLFGKQASRHVSSMLGDEDKRSFYSLRRTFATIASGTLDQVAVRLIAGWTDDSKDMSALYTQNIDDKRLVVVSNYVRTWLFGGAK